MQLPTAAAAAAKGSQVMVGEPTGGRQVALVLALVVAGVLGSVQALVLRGVVPHPWRWVLANMAGWAVAMPIIFVGATSAGATWSFLSVVVWGTLTGVVAGAALGLVTGRFLASVSASRSRRPETSATPS